MNASAQSPQRALPWRLDDFLLLECLGRGGMGEVFLASHRGMKGIDKLCVVKTLRKTYTQDDEYVNRFVDEARVVVQLNHRNICHVFDVGKFQDGQDQQYFLAMDFISGQTVSALHKRCFEMGKRLDPAVALFIVCETLEALDYAHRLSHPLTGEKLNLVHRDISPQNVMVNYEGEVKLIDFGLAASALKMEKTEPDVVMGKLAYMAPEQARGKSLDGRTDLFAVGVMLYELMVGERFYADMTMHEIWQVAGKGGFKPRRFAELDVQLQAILQDAINPDLIQRFKTCEEFRNELEEYRHQKKYRAGTREIRDLCADVFAEEQAELRKVLDRSLAHIQNLEPESVPNRASKTQSIARADLQSAIQEIDAEARGTTPPNFDTSSGNALPGVDFDEGFGGPTETAVAPIAQEAEVAPVAKTDFTNVLTKETTFIEERKREPINKTPWILVGVMALVAVLAIALFMKGQARQDDLEQRLAELAAKTEPTPTEPAPAPPEPEPAKVEPIPEEPELEQLELEPVVKPKAVAKPKPKVKRKPVVKKRIRVKKGERWTEKLPKLRAAKWCTDPCRKDIIARADAKKFKGLREDVDMCIQRCNNP